MNKLADRLIDPPAYVETITRYECPRCGNNCSCGIPYVPKTMRAADAIKANPDKSNRAIAADLGIDEKTVRIARADYSAPEPEYVTGRDGKNYAASKPAEPKPVDEDHLITNTANTLVAEITDILRKLSPAGRVQLRRIALEAWSHAALDETPTYF
jgi:hypothetical protein